MLLKTSLISLLLILDLQLIAHANTAEYFDSIEIEFVDSVTLENGKKIQKLEIATEDEPNPRKKDMLLLEKEVKATGELDPTKYDESHWERMYWEEATGLEIVPNMRGQLRELLGYLNLGRGSYHKIRQKRIVIEDRGPKGKFTEPAKGICEINRGKGWRVPEFIELSAIWCHSDLHEITDKIKRSGDTQDYSTDYSIVDAKINRYCNLTGTSHTIPHLEMSHYWSSSQYPGGASSDNNVIILSFHDGKPGSSSSDGTQRVRCVRDSR